MRNVHRYEKGMRDTVPVRLSLGTGRGSVDTGWLEKRVNRPLPTGRTMELWHSCGSLPRDKAEGRRSIRISQHNYRPNANYRANLQYMLETNQIINGYSL